MYLKESWIGKLRVRNTCWRRGARASVVWMRNEISWRSTCARALLLQQELLAHVPPGFVYADDNSEEERESQRERWLLEAKS